jgi:hypothetical protein
MTHFRGFESTWFYRDKKNKSILVNPRKIKRKLFQKVKGGRKEIVGITYLTQKMFPETEENIW